MQVAYDSRFVHNDNNRSKLKHFKVCYLFVIHKTRASFGEM